MAVYVEKDLTLTSVVFEYGVLPSAGPLGIYLTLTSVVFECFCFINNNLFFWYLTLTSVVFEYNIDTQKVNKKMEFNFNKCCI